MEPYRSDHNCSLGTAPKTVHSQLQRGSVTGDGYLEIPPVVGTDVRVSPNTSKVVITLVTTDRLLRDHRRLVFTRQRREQLLQCITFIVICIRLADSAANVDAARTTSS